MRGPRILLAPLSLVFGFIVFVRNWLFDAGVLPTTKVASSVISVGNISTGGTGKTPFVEYLARHLKAGGKKVAVISRGYKRTTSGYVVVSNGAQRCAEAYESGDEPFQLAQKLDGVVVAVDEHRVRAAKNVIAEFKPDVIVLDDGFQHRYLHRDLNIVLVANDELQTPGWLLPGGNLREPLTALRRADVVVVSRCKDVATFATASRRLSAMTVKPLVGMRLRATSVKNALTGLKTELTSLAHKRVTAFSGIGNPEQFEQTLGSLSLDVAHHHRFTDHHRYSTQDIEEIRQAYKNEKAEYIITTEKDVARLNGDRELMHSLLNGFPVMYLEIEPEVIQGEEMLLGLLAKI